MREIKFRAWDVNEKKMIYNGFAVAPTSPSWSPFRLEDWSNPEDAWGDYQYIDFTCFYGIENFILMQYTGLRDKNGKEVYEGDIYKNGENGLIGVLSYEDSLGGYLLYTTEKKGKSIYNDRPLYEMDNTDIEVIGNIYENPELIK